MAGNTHYTKLIEDYFEGSLSTSEMADLEHQIEIDPGLKSEFDLQNTIIETIRETRMVELKSHLNSINISWHHMIPNSWKVAASISLFSISSLSAFFLLEDTFKPETGIIEMIPETKIEQIEIDDATVPQIPEVAIVKEKAEKETYILKEEAPLVEQDVTEVTPTTTRQPVVVIPDIPDDFDDISNPSPMPDLGEEMDTFEPVTSSPSVLNMTTISDDKKYQFHYTLSEGELTLYGNFKDKDSPYEIMELNSSKGIKMFLYYKNNYYSLKKNTAKISPLEPVIENTLITELDILRENK